MLFQNDFNNTGLIFSQSGQNIYEMTRNIRNYWKSWKYAYRVCQSVYDLLSGSNSSTEFVKRTLFKNCSFPLKASLGNAKKSAAISKSSKSNFKKLHFLESSW